MFQYNGSPRAEYLKINCTFFSLKFDVLLCDDKGLCKMSYDRHFARKKKKKLPHLLSSETWDPRNTDCSSIVFSMRAWEETIFECTFRNVTTVCVPVKSRKLWKWYLVSLEEDFKTVWKSLKGRLSTNLNRTSPKRDSMILVETAFSNTICTFRKWWNQICPFSLESVYLQKSPFSDTTAIKLKIKIALESKIRAGCNGAKTISKN